MIRELLPSDDLELKEVSTTAAPSEDSKLHEVMYRYDGSHKKKSVPGRKVSPECRSKEELTTLTFTRTEHPHGRYK